MSGVEAIRKEKLPSILLNKLVQSYCIWMRKLEDHHNHLGSQLNYFHFSSWVFSWCHISSCDAYNSYISCTHTAFLFQQDKYFTWLVVGKDLASFVFAVKKWYKSLYNNSKMHIWQGIFKPYKLRSELLRDILDRPRSQNSLVQVISRGFWLVSQSVYYF